MRGRLLLALALLASPFAAGENVVGGHPIIVAVLDSGVDPDHQEFDYGGPSDAGDQIVAWWDFTTDAKAPGDVDPFAFPGATWDTTVAEPFDPRGHGTATASLVGGANLGACGATPKVSHDPGVKLAVLKVIDANGSVSGDVARAIRFAVEVVHADVLSMSLGTTLPYPNLGDDAYDALEEARALGVLPVVSAGNGLLNQGEHPFPTWMGAFGASASVVSVGGGSRDGNTMDSTTGNHDPDVSAWSDAVCVAEAGTTGGYVTKTGTSFAAPLVAGMAARSMALRLASGGDAGPDAIEALLERCARDTDAPYAREGWGFLGTPEFDGCVAPHATSGATPVYAGSPLNPLYHDAVAATARAVLGAGSMDVGPTMVRAPVPALTPPGVLGAATQAGLREAEGYRVHLERGQALHVRVVAGPVGSATLPAPSFDVLLVPAAAWDAGVVLGPEILAASGGASAPEKRIDHLALETGDHVVVVRGVLVLQDQPFSVETNVPLSFDGQAEFAGSTVSGHVG